jgi:FMN phosphatase YigB (HAD superfamily)
MIGIDLDSTLVATENLIHGVAMKWSIFEKANTFKMDNYPKHVKDEILNEFCHPDIMCSFPPYPGVCKKLNEWGENHEIFIITARTECIREATKKYIFDLFQITEDKIYFVNFPESKLRIFVELNLDYWIDDKPEDLITAKDIGIKSVMISNENTQYNHQYRKFFPWYESVTLIDYFNRV